MSIDKKNNMGTFRIRDRAAFRDVIFPIFEKYPLLTTKHFYYLRVKKVFGFLEDTNLTKDRRDQLVRDCLRETPNGYIAPPWTVGWHANQPNAPATKGPIELSTIMTKG